MGLDIRWPIGLMFSLVGLMLLIYGAITGGSNPELYKRSLDINVNLYWGVVLVVFGSMMLVLAWRGGRTPTPSEPQTEPGKPGESGTPR